MSPGRIAAFEPIRNSGRRPVHPDSCFAQVDQPAACLFGAPAAPSDFAADVPVPGAHQVNAGFGRNRFVTARPGPVSGADFDCLNLFRFPWYE